MRPIYFDYNATTPLDAGVREAMLPFLGPIFGNPSSVHRLGQEARAFLDEARERVAAVWQCKPSEVVFTSGGTESVNLALFGAARAHQNRGRHIITSAIEHHAVLHACEYLAQNEGFDVTYVPVDSEGIVSAGSIAETIRPDTILVSCMAANNEVGTIQPVAEIGEICQQRGVLFHTDAIQWFGKEQFASIHQFKADLVSACAHKYYGPKGSGALFVRSPLKLSPILFGGGHENERRAGTENLAGIAGFAAATERFLNPPVLARRYLLSLTDYLLDAMRRLGSVYFRGSADHRLANTLAFTAEGCDSATLLASLDIEGICASSGSACTSGSLQPSHVLRAMGVEPPANNSLIRFSLGRESTFAEVHTVVQLLPEIIARARRRCGQPEKFNAITSELMVNNRQ